MKLQLILTGMRSIWHSYALLALLLWINGCGDNSARQELATDVTPTTHQLEVQLAKEFERLGIDPTRVLAQAPTGNAGRVFDLHAEVIDPMNAPLAVNLSWTEYFQGDYDQNGEVNLADIAPLAQQFNSAVDYLAPENAEDVTWWPAGNLYDGGVPGDIEPPALDSGARNWRLARIDGDSNGEISNSDLTPIAVNWQQRITGYCIYHRRVGDDVFEMIPNPDAPLEPYTIHRWATYAPGTGSVDPLRPVRYYFRITEDQPGEYEYQVAPCDYYTSTTGEVSVVRTAAAGGPVALLNGSRYPVHLFQQFGNSSQFDASDSYSPIDEIVDYSWDYEGDGEYDQSTGTDGTLDYVYPEAGEFSLTVKVTDGLGLSDTLSKQVTVVPEPIPTNHMVEMSDGLKLSTDVYLPAGDGPWPVILVRTPYGKAPEAYETLATETTGMYYVLVVQDMRGRYDSEGDENIPLVGEDMTEPGDGVDTFAWVMAQEWCDGNIGTTGGSMLGMTQLYTAPHKPDGLKCQSIGVAPASMYHEFVYVGGAYRKLQMENWVDISGYDPMALDIWLDHPTYDEYWEQFNIHLTASEVCVPGMHISGWFDSFSQGAIDGWQARQYYGGVGAKDKQWLIMGPWTHGQEYWLTQGEVEFPENAANSPDSPYLSLMNHYLKGMDTGILDRPAITYYVMGAIDEPGAPGNDWRYADDWPIANTPTSFYLHEDGTLDTVAPVDESPGNWTFDPADPSPTIGGRNLYMPKGIYDQSSIESRSDTLLFTTAPLSESLEATGRVKCQLHISSDALDTDIAVRLTDVYPDGRSMLILDGILRLGYRDGFTAVTPLTPGEIYEVEIDLWSTSYIFNAGHKIRLSVTSSNYPRWDLNPGTGQQWDDGGIHVLQHNTLYHTAAQPSALILPIPDM